MGHSLYRLWRKVSHRLYQACHSNALQQTHNPWFTWPARHWPDLCSTLYQAQPRCTPI